MEIRLSKFEHNWTWPWGVCSFAASNKIQEIMKKCNLISIDAFIVYYNFFNFKFAFRIRCVLIKECSLGGPHLRPVSMMRHILDHVCQSTDIFSHDIMGLRLFIFERTLDVWPLNVSKSTTIFTLNILKHTALTRIPND